MKVVNIDDVPKQESDTNPLFTGKMGIQTPVTESEGADVNVGYVYFAKGVRNKLHSHTNDQVLIVTKGNGIVATESEQVEVKEGDIIYAPAGEKHWHGATQDSEFSHITITKAGTQLTQLEK